MESISLEKIAGLEARILHLNSELERAKQTVERWTVANSNLSLSAAGERAKNQGAGSGFAGGLLGSKYRAAIRAGAAASNAAIAKDVAQKRLTIANGKREAQDLVKSIQSELALAKQELKQLNSFNKSKNRSVAATKIASTSIDLLHKLKEAHQAGLLTDLEYEEKRKKLIDNL